MLHIDKGGKPTRTEEREEAARIAPSIFEEVSMEKQGEIASEQRLFAVIESASHIWLC